MARRAWARGFWAYKPAACLELEAQRLVGLGFRGFGGLGFRVSGFRGLGGLGV